MSTVPIFSTLVEYNLSMSKNLKIFIAGYDVMGKNMAGPGMRSLAMASFLSKHTSVTLSHDSVSEFDNMPEQVTLMNEKDVLWDNDKYWREFDIAMMPGTQILKTPLPKPFPIPLYVDIYDPFVLENIELLADKPSQIRDFEYLRHLKAMLEMLLRADKFIVTGERTRDFFTGLLTGWGLINPITASGAKFDDLFLVIPFGIPDEPFINALAKSKNEIPDFINEQDELIIWAGGLWDWLDPLKAIDAMPLILDKRPFAKLLFMGYRHPNKHIPLMETVRQCIDKARKLRLFGNSIIFSEWTPFSERIVILGQADLGLSLHKRHIETRYAFRTRIMDYIWAGIPMVISGGDNLALELAIPGVRIFEPGADVDEISAGVISSLETYSDKSRREKISDDYEMIRAKYRWSELLKPLLTSIQNPKKLSCDFYTSSFQKLLESFPEVSRPGIITRGIEKIKKKI